MAEEDTPRGDNWVDQLVEDPANPPQVQVLTGYRGRSAQEGHIRLYNDPELTGWADIPEDAILLTRETQDEHGLSKTLVWTRLDAQVQMGPQEAGAGAGAEWFQGQVAQDLGAGAGINIPRTPLCPTRQILCVPTPPRLCPRTPQCPTLLRTACCPPSVFQCPVTQNSPLCQFTNNPQICNQVATPNPGCIPIDIPGTPVFQTPGIQPQFDFGQFGGFGQEAQGFGGGGMEAQASQLCPQAATSLCPQPATQFCPQPQRTLQINCGRTLQLQCRRTIIEPQCLRPTVFESHCWQEIPPLTWQVTTPQLQFTPNIGGGGFAQGFEAQGGMGAQAVPQIFPQTALCPQPQTVFCPMPVTRICPITRDVRCIRTPLCPRTLACPQTPFCPVTPQCPWGGPGGGGDPWGGGGGGFGGGF